MMKETNYLQNAPRLSLYNVSKEVEEIQPGQFFHLNDDLEWEVADGTRRAYPTLNARYRGEGIGPQGELLEGRDNVTQTGKISVLIGNFEIGVDQYEKTETYTPGQALKVIAGGILAPFEAGDDPALIRGYVTIPPTPEDEFLTFEG